MAILAMETSMNTLSRFGLPLVFGLIACDAATVAPDVEEAAVVCNLAAAEITSILTLPSTPFDYDGQPVPTYIGVDNTGSNPITDYGATLGRVLFYDRALSSDGTISCASCHQQAFAFSDPSDASTGVNGTAGRHSMRLVNARFAEEDAFFWDERAATLELQTTQPIQDHVEMGFSGQDGAPSISDLVATLQEQAHYQNLFTCAFGDAGVSEVRMQQALAQFVRSIQSFDSRYDEGRAQVGNDGVPFPNFTAEENLGKEIFLRRADFNGAGVRVGGGAGCAGCHRPPEFDIDPRSDNNGVVGVLAGVGTDLEVTRSPSLRDVVKADGSSNGAMMHSAIGGLAAALAHYDSIEPVPGIDQRLTPAGQGQQLGLTDVETSALVAFLRTLAGEDLYTNVMWSDPFR